MSGPFCGECGHPRNLHLHRPNEPEAFPCTYDDCGCVDWVVPGTKPRASTITLDRETLAQLASAAHAALDLANERVEEANRVFADADLAGSVLCGIAFDIERRNLTVSVCAYCGAESPRDDQVIRAHMERCEKHPIAALTKHLRASCNAIDECLMEMSRNGDSIVVRELAVNTREAAKAALGDAP